MELHHVSTPMPAQALSAVLSTGFGRNDRVYFAAGGTPAGAGAGATGAGVAGADDPGAGKAPGSSPVPPPGVVGRLGSVGGAPGVPGAVWPGAPGISSGLLDRAPRDIRVNVMLVTKNATPRKTVVRVKVLAAPRGENSPPRPDPPPPIPSAPPSERCSMITKISEIATRR